MKYLLILTTVFFTGCLSTVPLIPTDVSRSADGLITRSEVIPVIDEANKRISSTTKKVPIHVKLYHMPAVGPDRLTIRENWSQPPHIYEYDLAERKYEEDIYGGVVESSRSMNIIDYIHSNIKRPSDFQSDHLSDPFIEF